MYTFEGMLVQLLKINILRHESNIDNKKKHKREQKRKHALPYIAYSSSFALLYFSLSFCSIWCFFFFVWFGLFEKKLPIHNTIFEKTP